MEGDQSRLNQDKPMAKLTDLGIAKYQGYQLPPEYPDMKQHTKEEIDNAQKAWNMTPEQMYNEIRKFCADKSRNEVAGTDFTRIANGYNEGDKRVKQSMENLHEILPRGYSSRELGMDYNKRQQARKNFYRAENRYLYKDKGFGIPSGPILRDIALRGGIKTKDARVVHDLLVLDDPINRAKTFVKNYGVPISKALETLFPHYPSWITKVLIALSNPSTLADLTGVTEDTNGITNQIAQSRFLNEDYVRADSTQALVTKTLVSFDTVAFDAIATIFCPEVFGYRVFTKYPEKTALGVGTMSISLTTDANGNLLVLINPLNPCAAASASGPAPFNSDYFMVQVTGWVPTTGVYTNQQRYAGPLVSNAGSFKSGKVSGFAVQYLPTTSALDNSGTTYLTYLEQYKNFDKASGSTDLQLSAMLLSPYTQETDQKRPVRGIYLPDDTDVMD
jgi:hypothetical protein